MYNQGAKRLLRDFNIERLISDIKDIKNVIRMKFHNLDKKKIKTCRSKVLEIDKCESDEKSDDSDNWTIVENCHDLFDGELQILNHDQFNWPKMG